MRKFVEECLQLLFILLYFLFHGEIVAWVFTILVLLAGFGAYKLIF